MSRLPWSIRIITALWGTLLFGASLLWPIAQGYDEVAHIDMAYVYSKSPFEFHGPGDLHYTRSADGIKQRVPATPTDHPLANFPVAPRGQRPTLDGLGGHGIDDAGNPNQMVQHPPLSYWAYAAVLRAPGVARLPWDVQVWLLRVLSAILVLPLPALCWAACRRLLQNDATPEATTDRAAIVAALVPVSMPNLARVCASVSNDVLLISASSFLLYFLVCLATGDRERRTGVGIGVSVAVALLAKGFALFLVPVVVAAYCLAALRAAPTFWRGVRIVIPLLVPAVLGGVLGGLWWMRNLIVYGTVQPNGFGPDFVQRTWGPLGDADDGAVTNFPYGRFLVTFTDRVWGGIGLADRLTPGPPLVFGWLALVCAGVLAAILTRGGRFGRTYASVVLAGVLLTIISILPGSVGLWVRHEGAGPVAAQGRYIYHFVVAVAAVAVVGWARLLRPGVWRQLPVMVLIGGLLTQALSWLVIVRNWYSADLGVASGLHALLRWSPLPAVVTIAALLLPALAGCVAFVALARGRASGTSALA